MSVCTNCEGNGTPVLTRRTFSDTLYWPIYVLSRLLRSTRNDPKFSDTQNICCNHSKILTMWLYHRVMCPNDADGMANSVDPDQTVPLGAA